MNDDLRSGFRDFLLEDEPPFLMSAEPSITHGRRRVRTRRRRLGTAALAAALVAVVTTAALTLRPSGTPRAVDPSGSTGTTPSRSDPLGGGVIPEAQRVTLPALTGTDLTGSPLSTDYAGHVTVINIWWSGCAPCATLLPELEAVREGAEPGTDFLGLNYRDTSRAARAFEDRNAIPWPTFDDPDGALFAEIDSVFPVRGLPSTLVVDQQGRVAAHLVGSGTSTDLQRLLDAVDDPVRSTSSSSPASFDARPGTGRAAATPVPPASSSRSRSRAAWTTSPTAAARPT